MLWQLTNAFPFVFKQTKEKNTYTVLEQYNVRMINSDNISKPHMLFCGTRYCYYYYYY